MPNHLSDSEMERIAKFVETPAYKRTPDLLLPEDDSASAD
jgi:hypothetical protein